MLYSVSFRPVLVIAVHYEYGGGVLHFTVLWFSAIGVCDVKNIRVIGAYCYAYIITCWVSILFLL
jgi:hypothetical protein